MPLQSRDARHECWADEQNPDDRQEQGSPASRAVHRGRKLRARRHLPLTLTATLLAATCGVGAFMFPGSVGDVLGAADWLNREVAWTALLPHKSAPNVVGGVARANAESPILIKAAAIHPTETGSVGAAKSKIRDFAWLPESPADQPALDPAATKMSAIALSSGMIPVQPSGPGAKAPFAVDPSVVVVSSKAAGSAPLEVNAPTRVPISIATAAETPRAIKTPVASEVAELIQRARYRLGLGDITGARLLLERAASSSEPNALMALAETYDPVILARLGVRGPKGDPAKARELYERAAASGVPEASTRVLALR
jgi:hypothetical protein